MIHVPIESNPTRVKKKSTTKNCLTRAEYIEFNENLFPNHDYNTSLPSVIREKRGRGRPRKITVDSEESEPENPAPIKK